MKFRAFTLDDQLAFAKLSGDNNPLHIDALAARRTMFGSPVVHGIHGVLRALDDSLSASGSHLQLSSLKAIFYKPIRVNDELQLTVSRGDDGTIEARILNEQSIVTKVLANFTAAGHANDRDQLQSNFPTMQEPRNLSDEDIANDSGTLELSLNNDTATGLFPNLVKHLNSTQLASIIQLSRLVGVRCPGLHSLFSELDLVASNSDEQSALRYAVKRFDHRVGLVTLDVNAPGLAGTVKAFRRPAPKDQPGYLELKRYIKEDEFVDQKALIIGGSRGLGEVTAKLLAGGGADVKLSYHQGRPEAEGIVTEITAAGGIASCFQYNALKPSFSDKDISASGWTPTHLYYFATPFIFSGVKGKFSAELFRQFCDYYVTGFANAIELLKEYEIKNVFYPSSVAVDELPTSMGEYASAKIASELLCEFLEKCNPGLAIYKSRFPRTETDQTVSIIPVKSEDPVELMIKELRLFVAR